MTIGALSFTGPANEGRRWDVEQTSFPAYEALRPIMERINDELADYEVYARRNDDRAQLATAERVRTWIQGDGEYLRRRLERIIAHADLSSFEEMRRSIDAAINLADLHRANVPDSDDNRELLLQWCSEVLLTLQRAFRDVADLPTNQQQHPGKPVEKDVHLEPRKAKFSWDASSGGHRRRDTTGSIAVAV